jgi:glutaredoxin
MSPNWRWRRCPQCERVERASDFVVLEYAPCSWRQGEVLRACPHCRFEAPTWRFPIVRERHSAAYQVARGATL